MGSPVDDAYLRGQAEAARKALLAGFDDLKATLAGTVDPRAIPRRFPIATLGAVAATGFVAALLAIPSKEQQELRKLERIRQALHPDPEPAKDVKQAATKAAAAAAKPPLWVTLLREGVQAARPLLVAMVTSSLKAKQGGDPPPEQPTP